MARERLPNERTGFTKRIHLRYPTEGGTGDLKIYITTGIFPDGRVGEIFLKADRAGSTISGLLDAVSICLSLGLQHGVPLHEYVEKLQSLRFEPSGGTTDPAMPRVSSIVDAVARYLRTRYLPAEESPVDPSGPA